MKRQRKLHIALVVGLLASSAHAVVITVGGNQTNGTGTLTFNQDITFTITNPTDRHGFFIIVDEIVQSDGTADTANFSGLTCSLNGTNTYRLGFWIDNNTTADPDVSANDGILYGNDGLTILPTVGDTITLHAGTGTMSGTETNFNPWSSGDYNMFLSDSKGNRISNVVPEPFVLSLVSLFGVGLLVSYRVFKGKGL